MGPAKKNEKEAKEKEEQKKKKKKRRSRKDDSSDPSSDSSSSEDDEHEKIHPPVEISCGFCLIEIDKLSKNSSVLKIPIQGGTPRAPVELQCAAEEQQRKGWQNIKK